ncbi:MAG: hypothetical protein KY467_15640 [Gemmatimonadetes bacterium]|nr:hypothetical protein [Gemmatimonadota bacterium]
MTEQPPAPTAERPPLARHGPAGWLVLAWLVVTAGRFAWAAATADVPWWSKVATAAVALLALAAVVPFLRFRRSGWEMAMWVLVTALVMDVARVVLGTADWLLAALAAGASAFCLGYAWRARGAFADDDAWVDEDRLHAADASAASTGSAGGPPADPVADALGAIHRRIVDAGSACAVNREELLADAARYGVTADALRREALPLYRTFLDHFRADGPLTAEEDRELFCLESRLELDAIAVARLRGDGDRPHAPAEPVDGRPPSLAAAGPLAEAADLEEDAEVAAPVAYVPGAAPSGLADYEQHELNALTRWAGTPLPPNAEPREALETLRELHRVSTRPPEEVEPGLPLDEGERCFAARQVELHRMPPGAQPDAAEPAPGAMFAGAFLDGSPRRDCDLSRYQRAGGCRFLVTDRRLLLVAPSGQRSPLPLDRIRSVRPCRNGVEVHPLRGAPVLLAFDDGVVDVAMRIARAVQEAGARRLA